MAIILFGSASNPADNGTGTTDPVVITPPGSMQTGDLVFVTVCFSGTSGTLTVSQAGGQSWTSLTTRNQTRNRTRSFWCIFNGTWSASPSWTGSGTANVIARMLVFRPNGGVTSTWAIDVAEASAVYAAASPVIIAQITTLTNGALVIAGWTSADDNTWGSLSGSTHTFTALTPAQVRNTSGTYQQSQTHAWMIDAAAGVTGTVQQAQATNGNDAGTTIIIAFKEQPAIDLVTNEGNEAQGSDSPVLTQTHNLADAEGAQAQASDNTGVTQTHVLASAENAQAQASDAPVLTGTHNLTADEAAQGQVSDTPTVTVTHVLLADEGMQGQNSDTPTVTEESAASDLIPDEGAQAEISDEPALSQTHKLGVDEGDQSQVSDEPLLTQTHNLSAQEGVQAQVSDSPAITQLHVLAPDESTQVQVSDVPTIVLVLILVPDEAFEIQVSDTPAITQLHVLGTLESFQIQAVDVPALTQLHLVLPAESYQAQISDSLILTLPIQAGIEETNWYMTKLKHASRLVIKERRLGINERRSGSRRGGFHGNRLVRYSR